MGVTDERKDTMAPAGQMKNHGSCSVSKFCSCSREVTHARDGRSRKSAAMEGLKRNAKRSERNAVNKFLKQYK